MPTDLRATLLLLVGVGVSVLGACTTGGASEPTTPPTTALAATTSTSNDTSAATFPVDSSDGSTATTLPTADAAAPATTAEETREELEVALRPIGPEIPIEPFSTVQAGPQVRVPHPIFDPEITLHSIGATATGWLAVGSYSPPGGSGAAVTWTLSTDGVLGEPDFLPSDWTAPSAARDVVVADDARIVVGSRSAGRESKPTVWILDKVQGWSMIDLPAAQGTSPGAVADHIVRLLDGTLVVVGRAGGPFFNDVVVWSSTDGGASWTAATAGISYYEPRIASDGERVAMVARIERDPTTAIGLYEARLLTFDDGDLVGLDRKRLNMWPGQNIFPEVLAWDGDEFLLGLGVGVSPAIAASTDGLTYEVQPLDLDSERSLTVAPAAIALVGEELFVGFRDGAEYQQYVRTEAGLERVATPSIRANHLEYLIGRGLNASTGSRFAYVAGDWITGYTLLDWDGEAWSSSVLQNAPPFRLKERLETAELETTSQGDLAILLQGVSRVPGDWTTTVAGITWRAADSPTWQTAYGAIDREAKPLTIASWHDLLLLVAHDFESNRSTIYLFDPASGSVRELTTFDGMVASLEGDADHLFAHVFAESGATTERSSLWYSPDANNWSEVTTTFVPELICGNGASVITEWMSTTDNVTTVGIERLLGGTTEPVQTPFTFQRREIDPASDQILSCGVGEAGVMTTQQGQDWQTADRAPKSRFVSWTPRVDRIETLVTPVSGDGSWRSWVADVAWSGQEWIAVGGGSDVERGNDALIWRSSDGVLWDPPITIAGGPGNQIAYSLALRDGQLMVGGVDGREATIWYLPS